MSAAAKKTPPEFTLSEDNRKWLLDDVSVIRELLDQWPLYGSDLRVIQEKVEKLKLDLDWLRAAHERGIDPRFPHRELKRKTPPQQQPTIVRAAAEATGGSDASFTEHLRGRVQRALAPWAAGGPPEDPSSEAPSIIYGGPESRATSHLEPASEEHGGPRGGSR